MKSRGTPCPIGYEYVYGIDESSSGQKWITCELVRDPNHWIWHRVPDVQFKSKGEVC